MFRDPTMRALAVVCILFLTLILTAGATAVHTQAICRTLLDTADVCLQSARTEDTAGAEAALSRLQEQWQNHRLFFAATQFHEDLDAVNTALQAAKLQLSDDCIDEFYAEIAEIRDTLEKMRDVQRLSIENIL